MAVLEHPPTKIRIGSIEFTLTDGIYRSATGSTWTVDAVRRYIAAGHEVEVITR